jgi:glycosyltransferase involved in cell wall biosynthesis
VCERCRGSRFSQCTIRRCKKDSLAASLVATLEAEAHRFLRRPAKADAFIAPSEFLRGKFIEFGWPADKFITLPNFNNQPLASHVDMPSGSRVLFAGRLERVKGLMTLVEALREAPGVQLDIAGDGPLRDEIEALAASPDWSGADIRLHGHVNREVLGQLTDEARLIAVPSEWYENSPYAVIEAFARARPVIATRIGGLPELVEDGVNGILVQPGSSEQIAEAVGRILGDSDLWNRLAHGARQTADERSAAEYVSSVEKLYASVLERSRP